MAFRLCAVLSRSPALVVTSMIKTACLAHLFLDHVLVADPCGGPSMLPTLEVAGERIWIDRRRRLGRGVAVGDVVCFRLPFEYGAQAAKRVIGMPGDYVLANTPEGESTDMIQVPQGHCWVTGDNLPFSRDSRLYGPLPLALITGKVVARGYPVLSYLFDGYMPLQRVENTLRPASNSD